MTGDRRKGFIPCTLCDAGSTGVSPTALYLKSPATSGHFSLCLYAVDIKSPSLLQVVWPITARYNYLDCHQVTNWSHMSHITMGHFTDSELNRVTPNPILQMILA